MRIHPALKAACFAAILVLAGCQTMPPAQAPEPELQLLQSAPLVIPSDCAASGSFLVSFTVATSGRTSAIRAPHAPVCVQEALVAWVESFQYRPPAREIPSAVEWLMVSARRGS